MNTTRCVGGSAVVVVVVDRMDHNKELELARSRDDQEPAGARSHFQQRERDSYCEMSNPLAVISCFFFLNGLRASTVLISSSLHCPHCSVVHRLHLGNCHVKLVRPFILKQGVSTGFTLADY